MVTLTLTMLAAAFLTSQLIRVEHRQAVDQVLRREFDRAATGLPGAADRRPTGSDGRRRSPRRSTWPSRRYLALHPGSDQHLTVIRRSARGCSAPGTARRNSKRCSASGSLPTGTAGRLRTVASPAGPLRVLTAELTSEGRSPSRR